MPSNSQLLRCDELVCVIGWYLYSVYPHYRSAAEIYNTISSQTECSLSRVSGKLQRMQSDEIVNRIRVCEMSITNNIRTTKNYEYALTPTAYKYLTKRPELLEQMTGHSGK